MRDSLYLIDTSVWLEVLPPGRAASELRERVDALLAADQVATTGMIRLELVSGARNEADYRRLEEMLSALHAVPVAEERWNEAAQLAFRLRRRGVVVPSTDLFIAAIAIAAGATVLHRDRHFDMVASHASLSVESHVPAVSGGA
ncbi:MAG: PIN domain-containing protein [Chloroflexi bacterium]|nr:PIN domain-containing protein [Chloroflexota bacterium]MCL5074463.1 PIN domain-containing protein [Chloroflexota bacterium]